MIINIRGTSGSGKSTIVREIMDLYAHRHPVIQTKPDPGKKRPRKQPLAYKLDFASDLMPTLRVLGHYETPCGGCDTIPSLDRIFNLVRSAHCAGENVLFEGLLVSAEYNRTLALHKEGLPLKVVRLTTSLEVCLSGINDRRLKRMGPEEYTPVNPRNTELKNKAIDSSLQRLVNDGVDVYFGNREQALTLVRGWLSP